MDEVAVLRALVEAYSPSGQEAEAVRTFVKVARSLGLEAGSDAAGNGIARIGRGPPILFFLGHIDTVEGELPVRVEPDHVAGRGTCDAKGALAAALVAASHHSGPGEFVIIGAVGEERDSSGARHLIQGARPDFLIVGEPSGWNAVTIGYRGTLSLVLHVEGERAHLSAPQETTLERGLQVVDRLRGFCTARRGNTPFHSPTVKVHSIDTNRFGSREEIEIGVNVRVPPSLLTEDVLAFLGRDPSIDRCHVADRSEAVQVDPRNEVVRALCAGIREQRRRPTLLRKLGTSDLNLAAPAWDCPSASYGPGDSHLDHTDQERLEIRDLQRSIQVLRTAFARLTSRSFTKSALSVSLEG
jgi:[amino group carrier protein]-lysine/ornithine hydrolase